LRALLVCLCLTSATASAAVILQTGFEPATYTAGQLTGQDGWTGTPNIVVQNSIVLAGTQAAQLNAAGLVQQIAFQPVSYNSVGNPDQVVDISINFYLESAAANNIWEVIGYSSTAGFQGQLIVQSNKVLALGNTSGFIQGPTVPLGVWNLFTASLDYNTQTVSAYLNGVFFASIAFSDPSTDLTGVVIGLNNAGGASTGSGYWDNLSIETSSASAIPEPATGFLIAAGITAACLIRRRR
jgi:hypothetical protein